MTAIIIGGSITATAMLPVFLTGAMGVQITAALGFGSTGLGLAVAAHRSGAAITSVFLGRLADELGAIRSIRLAAAIAAITSLGIATSARGLLSLCLWLALAGSSLTLAQPGANRLLMAIVDRQRLGTAFGLKQSTSPIASMISGAAVPLVATTVGWRWGFVLAAVAALTLVFSLTAPPKAPALSRVSKGPRPRLDDRGTIMVLALAFGLGTAASSVTTTFYVVSAASAGTTPQLAGTMLAAASFAAILARISSGIISDRIVGGHLKLCAGLLSFGSVGLLLLATGSEAQMSVGLFLALVGSWGFNGVFWFSLVRAYPKTPGRITGAISPGALAGSTSGPLFFGLLADQAGYPLAWRIMAGISVASACVMLIGNRRVAARHQRGTA